jgi:REP element-mobilizing transposase RayT
MSRHYKFHTSEGVCFVSLAVADWPGVFMRNEYKEILLENRSDCRQNKVMEVFAWCNITNHIHLVLKCAEEPKPEILHGYFIRFTNSKIIQSFIDNPTEIRKNWLPGRC